MKLSPTAELTATLGITLVLATGCGSSTETTSAAPTYESVTQAPIPSPVDASPEGYAVGTYVPTWLDDEAYSSAATLQGVNKVYLAFATPDAQGNVGMEHLSSAGLSAISTLGKQATHGMYLSVGGWGGTDEQHQAILDGFDWGVDHPEKFAENISYSVKDLEQTTAVKNIGVDLDFEYPDADQASKLPELVDALHAEGIDRVSMAVSADEENAAGLLPVASKLAEQGVNFNIMSYDLKGPWSDQAGPITTTDFTLSSIDMWAKAAGTATNVNVGAPMYGYEFVGADAAGKPFDQNATQEEANTIPFLCKDVDPASITLDPATGISGVQTEKGWASCLTPAGVSAIVQAAIQKHPDLGGAFAWDVSGMNQQYAKALQKQK